MRLTVAFSIIATSVAFIVPNAPWTTPKMHQKRVSLLSPFSGHQPTSSSFPHALQATATEEPETYKFDAEVSRVRSMRIIVCRFLGNFFLTFRNKLCRGAVWKCGDVLVGWGEGSVFFESANLWGVAVPKILRLVTLTNPTPTPPNKPGTPPPQKPKGMV